MKKNFYGNIEDIVQNVKFITPKVRFVIEILLIWLIQGTYTKLSEWPRISNGPDINHVVMGSEGNYGLVTEAIIKIKTIPDTKKFGSILFHDFEIGIKFMEEVGRSGIWAASMRLMDNTQFMFGMALKVEETSRAKHLIDAIKKYYVLNIKGFDQSKLCALILSFEGTAAQVAM